MEKLRCGVIYTEAFAAFLQQWWAAQPDLHATKVPSLDFVHCRDGARSGESWATLTWLFSRNLPDYECFEIPPVPLHLPWVSQKGLKWRCLDVLDGQLIVHGG